MALVQIILLKKFKLNAEKLALFEVTNVKICNVTSKTISKGVTKFTSILLRVASVS